MEQVLVSVLCLAYNHEDYIADAIESFLMQKTSFRFEVLINEDASTDRTAEIIKGYEKQYPDIIKPVYQTENQYSKHVGIVRNILIPKAKGKYIALCEGDDYWTRPDKLQKQVDFLENHPECYMCLHGADRVDAKTKKTISQKRLRKKWNNMSDAVGGIGRLVATNSMIFRKEIAPDFSVLFGPVGDYLYPIVAAKYGPVAYLDEIMSAYRSNSKNSFSQRVMRNPTQKKIFNENYEIMLDRVSNYTEHKYDEIIEEERIRIWFDYYRLIKDKKTLKTSRYKSYFNKLPIKTKVIIFLDIYFPNLLGVLVKIKRMLF